MATYRVHANRNYTVMSNTHLRDKNMSLKAKGLLSVMLSLPDNWDYSMNGLCAISKENITAIKSTLNELKELGYLVVTKLMPNETESGRIEYVYDIYESPNQAIEKQGIENLPLENQRVENHTQLNTKESITKKLNTKESNKDNNIVPIQEKRFIPPTVEDVAAYCQARHNTVDAERFIDYYESNGWKVGRNKMKDWKAAVRSWERNDFNKGKKTYGATGIEIKKPAVDDLAGIL